jgi:hypothetical protein
MLEQCIADCDSTLDLRPHCVSALVTRGLTILALAKEGSRPNTVHSYQVALRDFKAAMEIDPSNSQARVWYDEAMMLLSHPTLSSSGYSDTFNGSTIQLLGAFKSDEDKIGSYVETGSGLSSSMLASRFMH